MAVGLAVESCDALPIPNPCVPVRIHGECPNREEHVGHWSRLTVCCSIMQTVQTAAPGTQPEVAGPILRDRRSKISTETFRDSERDQRGILPTRKSSTANPDPQVSFPVRV